MTDNYSGADLVFSHNEFGVSPDFCKTIITCTSVQPVNTLPCQDLDENGDVVWNFGPSDYETVAPGTYVFTYEVGIDGLPSSNKQFTVTITLTDPCNPPVSLTPISIENQRYTITDYAEIFEHDDVIATPSHCPVRYEYIIPESAGSITHTDKEFNIYFAENLSLVGQTITVSVVAVSESRYDTTTTKQVTSNFDVTYRNPCFD